jgi:Uri superfamily endonuclease
MEGVPGLPGTYVLVLVVEDEQQVRVGQLGEFRIPPGWLAYVGSARGPGGLAARLARHLRHPKSPVWHIDFLRAVARPVAIWWATGTDRRECLWATALAGMSGASQPIPRIWRFGLPMSGPPVPPSPNFRSVRIVCPAGRRGSDGSFSLRAK